MISATDYSSGSGICANAPRADPRCLLGRINKSTSASTCRYTCVHRCDVDVVSYPLMLPAVYPALLVVSDASWVQYTVSLVLLVPYVFCTSSVVVWKQNRCPFDVFCVPFLSRDASHVVESAVLSS